MLADTEDPLGKLLSLPVHKPTVLNVHVAMTTQLDMDQRCGWVEGLGAIPAMQARVLLPSAGLRRIGVDERTGIPLGMDPPQMPRAPWGHAVDFSPEHDPSAELRRLLQIRDQACDGPGCPRTATGCELDHEQPWAEGGQTAAWNLRHRSTRCHHRKHDDWTVTRDETTGVSSWLSPAGSVFQRLSAWLTPTELPEDAVLPEPRIERPFHITPEAYELSEELPLWPTLPSVAPPHPPQAEERWDSGPPPF